jgi:hypothetical protein
VWLKNAKTDSDLTVTGVSGVATAHGGHPAALHALGCMKHSLFSYCLLGWADEVTRRKVRTYYVQGPRHGGIHIEVAGYMPCMYAGVLSLA